MEEPNPSITKEELYKTIRSQVHPVILRCSNDEYPYHGVGTAFIIEHANHLFAITAQHLFASQYSSVEDFRIFTKNGFHKLIFDRASVSHRDFPPHADLQVFRISPSQRNELIDLGVHWISLEDSIDIQEQKEAHKYYVFGYPEGFREYDYESKRAFATLIVLIGKITSPAIKGLSTIIIDQTESISMRGLSGSLVIADINEYWKFAGMVILASEKSGMINFIPETTIRDYLNHLVELETNEDFFE